MTELTECMLVENADEWFLEVQAEFRRGDLTKDTHAFLHGQPTEVPGSDVKGKLICRNQACEDNREQIKKNNFRECDFCKEERQKRKLVAEVDDPRLHIEPFVSATAIYPNQDLKCHAARARAVQWAREHNQELVWVMARDKASHGAQQQRPYTKEDKTRWLGYHDSVREPPRMATDSKRNAGSSG